MVCQHSLIVVLSFVAATAFAAAPLNQTDSANKALPDIAARSIKDFGAAGDGRTDDTAAIEAAVKAGKGAVYFPKGNYRLTRTVVVDLNVCGRTSLVGAGTATVIMAGPGPAFHFIGTHDGTGDPDSVRDQVWQRQRLPIITGFEIHGAHPESIGLRLEKTMQATLTNLLIRRCKIGIELVKRNRNLIIDHCHIYHNRQVGIDFNKVNLHQAIIADSHISYNPVAGIRLLGGEMRNFQIVGNDIEYNYDVKSKGSADILIDMTPPGSSFREGTIVGNTIQAKPSPDGANIRFLGGKNLKVGGLLAITGNLIGSQTHNIHLVNCRGVSISGNSLYSAAEHTLWLEDCANIVAGNNNIDWNPNHKKKHLVDGILIDRCKGLTLSNTIIENSFQGSSQSGGAIDVKASEDIAIVNCQVLDFRYRGITLTDAVRCRVTGCSVIERRREPIKGASIQVKGGRDNLITENIVNRGGLSIAKGTATVRGNLEITGATDFKVVEQPLGSQTYFVVKEGIVLRRFAVRKVSVFSLKRIIVIVTVLTIGLFFATSSIQSKESRSVLRKESPGLQAGTAKVDITPKKPVKMAGYSSRTGLSTGVHDPLSARVVVFGGTPLRGNQNKGKRLVLVSTDLLGFYGGTAEYLRKVILGEFQLEPSELFLSAIHTHAGPSLTIDKEKGHPNNLEYTEHLKVKLIEVIRKASSNMGPVNIGAGIGYSPVGMNRRELKFDSSGNSSIRLGRNPYGPTDKEVLVVKMTKLRSPKDSLRRTPDGADGRPIAALFDYATHATCLGGKNYTISGDVLGLAEQFVEKILGDDVITAGFAGASGNIDPWFRVLPAFNTEPGWIPEPVLLGTMLGEEVVHTFRDIGRVSGGGEIATAFVTLELPGKPRNEATIKKGCPPTPLNITAARVGDIAFVGIGCEVLTEIGMAIKAASPYKHTFVITHCNGAAGYLPPEHLYIEEGYEIRSSRFAPQAADIVVKQAVKMLHEL